MKDEIIAILDQARVFVQQHAPSELLTEAVPFGIVCLVAGIGLSVLGAKLGRFSMTCGFVLGRSSTITPDKSKCFARIEPWCSHR